MYRVNDQVKKYEWAHVVARAHPTDAALERMSPSPRAAVLRDILANNIAYVYARHPDPWMRAGSLWERYRDLLDARYPYELQGARTFHGGLLFLARTQRIAYEEGAPGEFLVRPLPLGEDAELTANEFTRARAAAVQTHWPVGPHPRYSSRVLVAAERTVTLVKPRRDVPFPPGRPVEEASPPGSLGAALDCRATSSSEGAAGPAVVLPCLVATKRVVTWSERRIATRHLQPDTTGELSGSVPTCEVSSQRDEMGALNGFVGVLEIDHRVDMAELRRINSRDARQIRAIALAMLEPHGPVASADRFWDEAVLRGPPRQRTIVAPQQPDKDGLIFGLSVAMQKPFLEPCKPEDSRLDGPEAVYLQFLRWVPTPSARLAECEDSIAALIRSLRLGPATPYEEPATGETPAVTVSDPNEPKEPRRETAESASRAEWMHSLERWRVLHNATNLLDIDASPDSSTLEVPSSEPSEQRDAQE